MSNKRKQNIEECQDDNKKQKSENPFSYDVLDLRHPYMVSNNENIIFIYLEINGIATLVVTLNTTLKKFGMYDNYMTEYDIIYMMKYHVYYHLKNAKENAGYYRYGENDLPIKLSEEKQKRFDDDDKLAKLITNMITNNNSVLIMDSIYGNIPWLFEKLIQSPTITIQLENAIVEAICDNDRVELLSILLKYKFNHKFTEFYNSKYDFTSSSLFMCISQNRIELVKILMKFQYFDLTVLDNLAIKTAILSGHVDMTKQLMKCNKLNPMNKNYESSLIFHFRNDINIDNVLEDHNNITIIDLLNLENPVPEKRYECLKLLLSYKPVIEQLSLSKIVELCIRFLNFESYDAYIVFISEIPGIDEKLMKCKDLITNVLMKRKKDKIMIMRNRSSCDDTTERFNAIQQNNALLRLSSSSELKQNNLSILDAKIKDSLLDMESIRQDVQSIQSDHNKIFQH
jgi:hypothetical protein